MVPIKQVISDSGEHRWCSKSNRRQHNLGLPGISQETDTGNQSKETNWCVAWEGQKWPADHRQHPGQRPPLKVNDSLQNQLSTLTLSPHYTLFIPNTLHELGQCVDWLGDIILTIANTEWVSEMLHHWMDSLNHLSSRCQPASVVSDHDKLKTFLPWSIDST